MNEKSNSILVVGFNTRPLAYSLNKAGYEVYAVDFFGDLDLFPYVKDNIIVMEEIEGNYQALKDKYSTYLTQFALKLYNRHQDTTFLLIGSGLDDAYEERKLILDEIKDFCRWIVDKLGENTPVHFSRFHPDHNMTNIPRTPMDDLLRIYDAARETGVLYPYLGNVMHGNYENTVCPKCGSVCIERIGFSINLDNFVKHSIYKKHKERH